MLTIKTAAILLQFLIAPDSCFCNGLIKASHWLFSQSNYCYFKGEYKQGYVEMKFRFNGEQPLFDRVFIHDLAGGKFEYVLEKQNLKRFRSARIYHREASKLASAKFGFLFIEYVVMNRGKPESHFFRATKQFNQDLIELINFTKPCQEKTE